MSHPHLSLGPPSLPWVQLKWQLMSVLLNGLSEQGAYQHEGRSVDASRESSCLPPAKPGEGRACFQQGRCHALQIPRRWPLPHFLAAAPPLPPFLPAAGATFVFTMRVPLDEVPLEVRRGPGACSP